MPGETEKKAGSPVPNAQANSAHAGAEEELSEEDQRLKEQLETLVDVLTEKNARLYESALNSLTTLIRTSTSSMTAVPKPLKFLKPHYGRIEQAYASWDDSNPLKPRLAGVLSVLGMTQGTALAYRLKAGCFSESELAEWGHDYLRHLSNEIGLEFHKRQVEQAENMDDAANSAEANGTEANADANADSGSDAMNVDGHNRNQDLLDLALRIVPFFLQYNAETDAVDLLLEIESIERLSEMQFADTESSQRVCMYLVACASYLDSETASAALATAFTLYKKSNDAPQALLLALRLDDESLVRSVFSECQDPSVQKQLALILAQQRRFYDISDIGVPHEIVDLASNSQLAPFFAYLVKELNLEKPKLPAETLGGNDGSYIKGYGERTKMTLVSIFARGFINAGFCNLGEGFNTFLNMACRTRNVCAAAAHTSIGLGYLWNYGSVLEQLDMYMDPRLDSVWRAGAVLGVGVGTAGVHDETDAVLGVLGDYLQTSDSLLSSAILSLGFAYAGTSRPDLLDYLAPFVADPTAPVEVSALATLALGLVFVSTAHGELTQTFLEALMERPAADLSSSWGPIFGLGLALLYINKTEKIEAAVEAVKTIDHPIAQSIEVLLTICAYAGSGNVIQIQKLLKEAATRVYEDEDDGEHEDGEHEDGEEQSKESKESKDAGDADADDATGEQTGSHGSGNNLNGNLTSSNDDDVMAVEPTNATSHEDDEESGKEATSSMLHALTAGLDESTATALRESAEGNTSSESNGDKSESAKVKGLCTLGVALIAMGENIGEEMVLRHLEHLMHSGDSSIRQAVPLAIGLLYTSNPQMKVYETLSRYTHDGDVEVAANAIFAMGLVGAGTLNARIAQLLRQLDEYHGRQTDLLFMVRFALGLVNLGKGTQSLSPFTAEKQLLSPVSLSGLLIVSIGLLMPNSKQFMLSEQPSLFYSLVLAIQPRMIVTVDEDLKPLKVTVRIGQAVDTVGQAGKPKRITGWVTQDTPVLISAGERAELESDEYEPLSSVLEGIVILRKKE